MKLSAVVLCALIGAATLEFANSDPSADVCASEDEPQTYSIVKDIINKIIKELEGSKDHRIPKIEIGSKSSLDDILIHSEIGKTTLIMDDSNTRINIKNLTLPVNLLNVEGQYEFEDFPGGLQIYGNGNFSIRIVELNIFVSLEAKYKSVNGKWTVQNVKIDTSAEQTLIRFYDLMNGEPMGDFLNFMLTEFVQFAIGLVGEVVEYYKTDVMTLLEKILNGMMPGNY